MELKLYINFTEIEDEIVWFCSADDYGNLINVSVKSSVVDFSQLPAEGEDKCATFTQVRIQRKNDSGLYLRAEHVEITWA